MDNPGCSCSFCQPKIEARILAKSNLAFVFDNWPFHRRSVLDPSQRSSLSLSLSQIARYLQTRFPTRLFTSSNSWFSDILFFWLAFLCWMKTKQPAEIQRRLKRRERNTSGEGLRFGQFQEKCRCGLYEACMVWIGASTSVCVPTACLSSQACMQSHSAGVEA